MFNGKPVCEKCDRFLHKSLPTSTGKLVSVKKPYEEAEVYKQEVIHDGRALHDVIPGASAAPSAGLRGQARTSPRRKGGMRSKYITRCVESEKEEEREIPHTLMMRVKDFVLFTGAEK
ncbi:hypothetical protein DFJ58DRAFT_737107 [Suillus subalutaceus]|uniref:uncharacterized protein n=1 Tax=Suillus subalutaceus TaxID=48586 RepID=UPI001B877B3C|nr:uncharacterized protein DFJ58DRAFT_737107 [Suillus subalutaceus]KAG1830069.1 hypothetical protein DFJ58DRAFT_737107 [Suillus subalutaceus]